MQQAGLKQRIGDPGVFTGPTVTGFANSDEDLDNIEGSIEEHVELEKLGLGTKSNSSGWN